MKAIELLQSTISEAATQAIDKENAKVFLEKAPEYSNIENSILFNRYKVKELFEKIKEKVRIVKNNMILEDFILALEEKIEELNSWTYNDWWIWWKQAVNLFNRTTWFMTKDKLLLEFENFSNEQQDLIFKAKLLIERRVILLEMCQELQVICLKEIDENKNWQRYREEFDERQANERKLAKEAIETQKEKIEEKQAVIDEREEMKKEYEDLLAEHDYIWANAYLRSYKRKYLTRTWNRVTDWKRIIEVKTWEVDMNEIALQFLLNK